MMMDIVELMKIYEVRLHVAQYEMNITDVDVLQLKINAATILNLKKKLTKLHFLHAKTNHSYHSTTNCFSLCSNRNSNSQPHRSRSNLTYSRKLQQNLLYTLTFCGSLKNPGQTSTRESNITQGRVTMKFK